MSEPLPICFDEGLRFGDPEQINYVKSLRAEALEVERMLEQGMQKYRVRVYVEGEYVQDVYACNEEEACAKVKDEFDMDYADLDIQYDAEEMEIN